MDESSGEFGSDFEASEASHEPARRTLRILILLTLTTSVVLAVLVWSAQGPGRLPVEAVRFVLTGSLLGCVYLGKAWARWLTVALFGLALVIFAVKLPSLAKNGLSNPGFLMGLAFYTIYVRWLIVLLVPGDVTRYFQSRRFS